MKHHPKIHSKILGIDHALSVSLHWGLYYGLYLLVERAQPPAYSYLAPVALGILPVLHFDLKLLCNNLWRHGGVHFRFDSNLRASLHPQLILELADLLSQTCHLLRSLHLAQGAQETLQVERVEVCSEAERRGGQVRCEGVVGAVEEVGEGERGG